MTVSDAVGERGGLGVGHVAFHDVAEDVHAAGLGLAQGHAQGQLRVDDGRLGEHDRVRDSAFDVGRPVGDDGAVVDLRAGAGQGRHLDDGRDLSFHLEALSHVAPDGFGAARGQGQGLGRVHGAAAAQADDYLNSFPAGQVRARVHRGRARVGLHLFKDQGLDALGGELPCHPLENAHPADVGVGDHQGLFAQPGSLLS